MRSTAWPAWHLHTVYAALMSACARSMQARYGALAVQRDVAAHEAAEVGWRCWVVTAAKEEQ